MGLGSLQLQIPRWVESVLQLCTVVRVKILACTCKINTPVETVRVAAVHGCELTRVSAARSGLQRHEVRQEHRGDTRQRAFRLSNSAFLPSDSSTSRKAGLNTARQQHRNKERRVFLRLKQRLSFPFLFVVQGWVHGIRRQKPSRLPAQRPHPRSQLDGDYY